LAVRPCRAAFRKRRRPVPSPSSPAFPNLEHRGARLA